MSEGDRVNDAITYADASLTMEGLHLDEDGKIWCKKLLLGVISFDEYLAYTKQRVGVLAK